MYTIKSIYARQVLDSRGNPTVETEVVLAEGGWGRAIVPSGASVGKHEALELRDGDQSRYHGLGVNQALSTINQTLSLQLVNQKYEQSQLDQKLIELDGTENKSKLGANTILSISLAFAWAVARAQQRALYEYIGELYGNTQYRLPKPLFNIMNGGRHANWATDVQEYMVIPAENKPWREQLRIGSEIYHTLGGLLKNKGYSTNVGDEGGFAPIVNSNREALDLLEEMVRQSGYKLGDQIQFGFDVAASEFYDSASKTYNLKRDSAIYSTSEMINWEQNFIKNYPIALMEDVLDQDDWEGWTSFTQQVGNQIRVIGDDLLVTNVRRIEEAIGKMACTGLLVKLNQIGTLTETLAAMKKSQDAGWINIVSHRSGETEDVTIAHLAVGTAADYIKTGAPARGERTAKYNELLRIAERVEK